MISETFESIQRFSCKLMLQTRVMPRECLRAIEYCVNEYHSLGKRAVTIERIQFEPRHECRIHASHFFKAPVYHYRLLLLQHIFSFHIHSALCPKLLLTG